MRQQGKSKGLYHAWRVSFKPLVYAQSRVDQIKTKQQFYSNPFSFGEEYSNILKINKRKQLKVIPSDPGGLPKNLAASAGD